MIKASDVVIVNQRPRVQKKLGLDAEACKALRPDVVHVSIIGFGLEGKRSDWTCYDLIAEGYSGVMDITGEPDGAPQKVGTPVADILAGSDALGLINRVVPDDKLKEETRLCAGNRRSRVVRAGVSEGRLQCPPWRRFRSRPDGP